MIKNHQGNRDLLLGVVMCGGESKRMGSDKGLLPINNSIWAKHIGCKLELLDLPVIYSINSKQEESYSAHINKTALVTDLRIAEGPLNGLLSVHVRFPKNDLMVLACDMLDHHQQSLRSLITAYQNGNDDFYAFHDGEFFEPLCALYTWRGLNKIYKEAQMSNLVELSLQSILRYGKTKKIQPQEEDTFNNYNNYRVTVYNDGL